MLDHQDIWDTDFFSGRECHVEVRDGESKEFIKLTELFPEDINSLQVN